MSQLFSPLTLRDLTLKNRTVVAPMCQYSAQHGLANDWHFVHLGRLALGGFGLIIVEATAVTPEGRITHADLGLWEDAQIPQLKRIVDFMHSQGSAAGIQLAHAGRKASDKIWWRDTPPETDEEKIALAYEDWQPVAPSAVPHDPESKMPAELDHAGIARIIAAFADAARRADEAGFDVIEIHGAHGYLVDEFLSPLANKRTDEYGGSRGNRMRFALEIVEAVRNVWPDSKPLLMRFSVEDGHPDGWQVEDSIVLAKEIKARGVDLIDCSSGGFAEANITPAAGYQVPLAASVREQADISTMAVGLITKPEEAEAVIAKGNADLVALGRMALDDPNWPVHARHVLGGSDDPYTHWPKPVGFVVKSKDEQLGGR